MKKILLSIIVLTVFCSTCFSCPPSPPSVAELRVIPNNAYVIKDKPVLLDGSQSIPGSGSIIRYQWDFNGDNKYDYAEGGVVHPDGTCDGRTWHKFENTGTVTVKLMVTNSAGYWDTAMVDVNVSEDSDGDGLPDAWERYYFNNSLGQTGNDNYDFATSDTFTNLQEYMHGTNPASFTSSLPTGVIVAHGGATPIQSAINASIDGDTIIVLPGTYNGHINFYVANRTLRSIDPNNWEIVESTVIKANGQSEWFEPRVYIDSGANSNTILEGFVITEVGTYTEGGGEAGIKCDGTSPKIRKCVIKGNRAGGISLKESSAIIENCFIMGNDGSGINTNGYGAGSPQISNCVLYGNNGCGLALFDYSTLTLRNCTIVGNGSSSGSGGIYTINGTVDIYNTVVWENYPDEVVGTINPVNCWIKGVQQGDPCFANINFPAGKDGIYGTRDDGLRLKTNSPCVDAGYDTAGTPAPSQDIIGQGRVDIPAKSDSSNNLRHVDIGAYELNKVWFVKQTASGNGSGSSWANACTLQTALSPTQGASAGDEIWMASGTSYKPGSNRSDSFTLRPNVSVYGGFTGTETDFADRNYSTHKTILSGDIGTPNVSADNSYTVVRGANGALLDGFDIQDACSADNYGGINAYLISMSVRNCVITNNHARYGGGINCYGGSMLLANCVLANNSASAGGGAFCTYNYSYLTGIVNCTITSNSATYESGGIYNYYGSQIIQNSIIWGNTAPSNNNIYNYNCIPMISYSDIEGSIVSDTWQSSFGNNCGRNIALNPQFVDSEDFEGADGKLGTADDGLELQQTSPCINAGDNSVIHEANDITGYVRKFFTVDMGAYECKWQLYKPSNPLYAGGSKNSSGNGGVVYQRLPSSSSWQAISGELGKAVLSLCYHGNKIYAGTRPTPTSGEAAVYQGVETSGTWTWTKVSNDNWGDDYVAEVLSLIEYKGNLYAGTTAGPDDPLQANLYRYNDATQTWTKIPANSDYPTNNLRYWGGLKCLYEWNGILYMGDVFNDRIAHYEPGTIPMITQVMSRSGSCTWDLQAYQDRLYASADGGAIFRSAVNDGSTWPLPQPWKTVGNNAWEVEEYNGKLFIGSGDGLYNYAGNADPALCWQIPYEDGRQNEEIISMLSTGDYLYIGTGSEFGNLGSDSPPSLGGDPSLEGNIYVSDGFYAEKISDGLNTSGIQCLLKVDAEP